MRERVCVSGVRTKRGVRGRAANGSDAGLRGDSTAQGRVSGGGPNAAEGMNVRQDRRRETRGDRMIQSGLRIDHLLLSPPAAYITGAVLPIDGGLTAHLGVHR